MRKRTRSTGTDASVSEGSASTSSRGAAACRHTAPRALVFAAAGLVCMLVMLTLMKEVFFGVQIIAGARSLPGFWTQAIAGALAGLAFTALTPPALMLTPPARGAHHLPTLKRA